MDRSFLQELQEFGSHAIGQASEAWDGATLPIKPERKNNKAKPTDSTDDKKEGIGIPFPTTVPLEYRPLFTFFHKVDSDYYARLSLLCLNCKPECIEIKQRGKVRV